MVDWAAVGLRSGDGKRIRQLDFVEGADAVSAPRDLPQEGLASSEVVTSAKLLYVADLATSAHPDLQQARALGFASAVVAPMTVNGQTLGAILVARRDEDAFSENDTLVLIQAASFIAAVVKSIRAAAEAARAETSRHKAQMMMRRRAGELDALNRITVGIDDNDLAVAMGVVANEIAALRGIEVCRVSGLDADGDLVLVSTGAKHGARFSDGGPIMRQGSPDRLAVDSGSLVLWRRPDAEDAPTILALQDTGTTSLFSLPIIWKGTAIGCLTAGSIGGHRLVTDEHIIVGEIVCNKLAQAAGERSDKRPPRLVGGRRAPLPAVVR